MAATNIFYRIPSQRGTRIASIAGTGCTLEKFCDYIIDSEGLNRNDFIIASGTKVFRPSSCILQSINLQNNSHVDILIPLLGGKGGFGSLLRAIGAQIEKTTNRDACRDLSGRRLRDIKREDELKKLIALQEKLQNERKRRKKERLEKLKKKVSDDSKPIQELVAMFDDHSYNKRRLELADILEAAVDKGIINFKKRQHSDENPVDVGGGQKKARIEDECLNDNKNSGLIDVHENKTECHETSSGIDQKVQPPSHKGDKVPRTQRKTKMDDLWLGLDDDDDDDVVVGDEKEDHRPNIKL